MVNYIVYQLYYSPLNKLEHFLIKNLDKVYPYVVAYMKFRTNLQLIIYNEFLSTTLVEVTLVLRYVIFTFETSKGFIVVGFGGHESLVEILNELQETAKSSRLAADNRIFWLDIIYTM